MIRKTLLDVKKATFSVLLPDKNRHGMPTPMGTGFFVSPDGWFITAAHVISKNGEPRNGVIDDIQMACLQKEKENIVGPPIICQHVTFEYINAKYDIALLKVDFGLNSDKQWLKTSSHFPYIEISKRELELGEPVYSFGYPLSESQVMRTTGAVIGSVSLSPRVTSAIVSSKIEKTSMVMTSADPKMYVLDKALNYGSSGSPIVSTDTGKVHAFGSHFQPVYVRQPYVQDQNGTPINIMIPSLYGVVVSLSNDELLKEFENRKIPLSEN